jgi:hypothetical protein
MTRPVTAHPRRSAWWLAGLFLAMLAIGTDEFVIAGVLPECGSIPATPCAWSIVVSCPLRLW